MEAVLLLAVIAQRFRLELVPDQNIRPMPYVTLRPDPGMRVVLRSR
jgi:cytochrome P450